MKESDFIQNLLHKFAASSHPQISLGIGDDAGILRLATGSDILISKDVLTEGVDFLFPDTDPFTVGRKALAVNLSDMAAMACRPVAVLVGLVLPETGGAAIASGIMEGVHALAQTWSVGLLGGDTNTWPHPKGTVISITIVGEPFPGISPITRRGARPGDVVMVTGTLGGSIHGKQFHFTPRLREAEILARTGAITAMIDLSDGLAKDAGHIAASSGVEIEIDATSLPLAGAAAGDWQRALTDGEDFELCFTCAPEVGERLLAEQPCLPVAISKIGIVRQRSDTKKATGPAPLLFIRDGNGKVSPLLLKGFDHSFS